MGKVTLYALGWGQSKGLVLVLNDTFPIHCFFNEPLDQVVSTPHADKRGGSVLICCLPSLFDRLPRILSETEQEGEEGGGQVRHIQTNRKYENFGTNIAYEVYRTLS